MAKYLNQDQRETIVWLNALTEKLKQDSAHWPAAKRKHLNAFIPKLEDLMLDLMQGIDDKDGAMVVKMAGAVTPVLRRNDFSETDEKITVDWEQVYTLAEWGLEFCVFSSMVKNINKMTNARTIKDYIKQNFKAHECEDPDQCPARRVFLHFMIPPLTPEGTCQYFRGGDNN